MHMVKLIISLAEWYHKLKFYELLLLAAIYSSFSRKCVCTFKPNSKMNYLTILVRKKDFDVA